MIYKYNVEGCSPFYLHYMHVKIQMNSNNGARSFEK